MSSSVIPACLNSRKRVAGTQWLRVAASLFGRHAVSRGLREEPDRSTDPLLACGVLNSVGTESSDHCRSRCASSSALPRIDRYATRWVPASAGMTEDAVVFDAVVLAEGIAEPNGLPSVVRVISLFLLSPHQSHPKHGEPAEGAPKFAFPDRSRRGDPVKKTKQARPALPQGNAFTARDTRSRPCHVPSRSLACVRYRPSFGKRAFRVVKLRIRRQA